MHVTGTRVVELSGAEWGVPGVEDEKMTRRRLMHPVIVLAEFQNLLSVEVMFLSCAGFAHSVVLTSQIH